MRTVTHLIYPLFFYKRFYSEQKRVTSRILISPGAYHLLPIYLLVLLIAIYLFSARAVFCYYCRLT